MQIPSIFMAVPRQRDRRICSTGCKPHSKCDQQALRTKKSSSFWSFMVNPRPAFRVLSTTYLRQAVHRLSAQGLPSLRARLNARASGKHEHSVSLRCIALGSYGEMLGTQITEGSCIARGPLGRCEEGIGS